jgi:thymidylate synthase
MPKCIEVNHIGDGYPRLIRLLKDDGVEKSSRNGDTLEIEDMMITVKDPRRTLPVGMGAAFNRDLYLLEAAQLVAGRSEPELMWKVAPNTRQFAEENGQFWGAYGPRTNPQFDVAVDRLAKNHDDRQVIVTFWDKNADLFRTDPPKKDHPCTLHMRFGITNGVLTTSTVMRSNDVNWGFKYDLPVFCTIHLTMAAVLNVEPGVYTHHAHSFHMYDRDRERMNNIISRSGWDIPMIQPMVVPTIVGTSPSWEWARQAAMMNLDEIWRKVNRDA